MKESRYKVDVRVGCAAVVDTFYPNDSNCLDFDNPGVITYKMFKNFSKPTVEELMTWDLDVKELQDTCNELNAKNTVTKEEVNKAFVEFNASVRVLKQLFPKVYNVKMW